ncbi:MAG: hypothetical protein PHY93_14375 [Bacteriovorax sp.]|nr:hypothetical protein [Bacteriovorax sp.]
MKYLLASLSMVLISTSFSHAEIPSNRSFKKGAIEKFLQEANNPASKLGARIAQINKETEDGRNQDGTINLPIKRSDLQVVLLDSEEITNPWHYSNKNEKGDICSANTGASNFLILLSSTTGVHMASEFSTYTFKVNVDEIISAKRKDGKEIEYCDDVAYDENQQYIDLPSKMEIGEISEVNLQDTLDSDKQ